MKNVVRNKIMFVVVVAILCTIALTSIVVLLQNDEVDIGGFTEPVYTSLEVTGEKAEKNIIIDEGEKKHVDIIVEDTQADYFIIVEAPSVLDIKLVNGEGEHLDLIWDNNKKVYFFDSAKNGTGSIDGYSLVIADDKNALKQGQEVVSIRVEQARLNESGQ